MTSRAGHCRYASDLLADAAGRANLIIAGELIWGVEQAKYMRYGIQFTLEYHSDITTRRFG